MSKRKRDEDGKMVSTARVVADFAESRTSEAFRQLICGGLAGSVAKTITAPFSRLTILFQVHSMVTTKEHRPKFAMSIMGGMRKIVERGGVISLWKGNMTSVLHRFPYSAINFYIYENSLDVLSAMRANAEQEKALRFESTSTTPGQIARRLTFDFKEEKKREDAPALHKFMAGGIAGTTAVVACYPLELVRTRLTTELEGKEHYRGIADAFRKIAATEGPLGFYAGIGPTLLVAVPNFAISYTVYGTLKEYTLDDDLFYNLRRIDSESGEARMGLGLTVLCGASSGIFSTLLTFPMDTIRRRMQVQNLHIPKAERLSPSQQFWRQIEAEGFRSLYRGLTPELVKVVPMVSTMFLVYEGAKDLLNVDTGRR